MRTLPTVDESYSRLHANGWSIGDTAYHSDEGMLWLVTGTRGEHSLRAEGKTQAEAWGNAVHLAQRLGLVDGDGEK